MPTLFLDHNVAYATGVTLQNQGYPAYMARDLGLARGKDFEILAISARRGWTVITHNAKDFQLLHGAWLHWPTAWGVEDPMPHAGILIIPDTLSVRRSVQEITNLLHANPDLTNALYVWRHQHGWQQDTSSQATGPITE